MERLGLLSRRKRTKTILLSQRSSNTRKRRKTSVKRGLKDSFYLHNMESTAVPKGIIVESLGLLSGRKGIFRPKDRPTQGMEGKPSWKGVLKVYCTFLMWNLRLSPKESLWRHLACSRDESGRKGFFRPQDRPTQGKEGKPPWKGVLKVYFTFLIWNLRLHPKESLWIALACARDERGRKGSSNPKDRPTQGKEGKPSRKSFFKDHFTFLIWNLRVSPKGIIVERLGLLSGTKRNLSSQRSCNSRNGRKTFVESGLKGSSYLPNVESKVFPKGIIVETLGLLSGRKWTKRILSSPR